MVKSHKTVIGDIKDICEQFDFGVDDNGSVTLERIRHMINLQLRGDLK